MHALRSSPGAAVRSIAPNFIYEHSTITSLAQFASSVAHAESTESDDAPHKIERMEAMLEKYCASFPQHVPTSRTAPDKDVVLLTGTTGGLGSNILAHLVASDTVGRVFALNRPSRQGESLLSRQVAALADRGLDPNIAHSPKVVFVEGDFNEGLGVSQGVEDEVSSFLMPVDCGSDTVV